MNLGLEKKTALVTAASRGLGKACAMRFAAEGASVAICARHSSTLNDAAEDIRAETGAEILPIVADLTYPEDITEMFEKAREEFRGIDVCLINVGGPPAGSFMELDDVDWQAAFQGSLLAIVRVTREVLPDMVNQGWGRIIYVSSIAAERPIRDFLVSTALRAGVEGVSKTLSKEYATDGITFNSVRPGFMSTGWTDELSDAELQEITETIPMQRFGEPGEFADAAAFLASERAGYVTGETLQIDGGFLAGSG